MLEYLCPHNPNHQSRKRRPSIESGAKNPPKRARLTKKNLKAFEKMAGRQRKSAMKKSTVQWSSTTTTTEKDFATKLQRNGVIYSKFDAQAPDDVAEARELLNRQRESESPDQSDFEDYVVVTEEYKNEFGVGMAAYPFFAKKTTKRGSSGYFPRLNQIWSAVDNHLTTGLSHTQPDLVESYREIDYPSNAVETISGDLIPSSHSEAMPAYAVEFKSSSGDMNEAKLQCAYDGALMTEGAHAIHAYMGKSDDDFYGRAQALTVSFNGRTLDFYTNHAVKISASSYEESGKGVGKSAGAATGTADAVEYHQYLLVSDDPRFSFEDFQTAYRHTRNAQDIGYKWATERKDALWAYTNRDRIQTQPKVPTSAQQSSNDSLASSATDDHDYDADDDEVDPTDQLLQ